ncbi:MAG TPA: hypothetical protein VJL31_18930 [Gemmatimonadales bacterium]|nr:hypothetical protein [Gemmatimonadales bacterium]
MSATVALRILVWTFVALGFLALAGAALVPPAPPQLEAHPAPASPLTDPMPIPRNLDSAASLVATRNLFRRSRQPSPISSGAAAPTTQPGVPKPVLRLAGLVVGADPSAVIEGFPGLEGPRVVRVGDVIGQLTVRRVDSALVEVTGMDTTWVLRVRRP